jgi:ribosomal protein S18 acetylase RimI-like enzyme
VVKALSLACSQTVAAEPHYFNVVLGPLHRYAKPPRGGEANPPMSLKGNVDLTIRHAEAGDAAAIARLMCELGYETTKSEMQTRVERIATDERYCTFVAVRDGKVSGMISTLRHATHEHDDYSGKIIALVVSKKQRRCGIGRALIAAAEKDFRSRGVTRVSLTTRFARRGAHRFYESLGYSRTGFRFAKTLR